MARSRKQPDPAETAFLAAYDASAFPHPSVAVDVALLTIREGRLATLLRKRDQHPERGAFALPGSFVALDESLDAAAARTLRDKADLDGVFLEQLYTFGAVDRDPRTRVISVAYYALVDEATLAAARLDLFPIEVDWEDEAGGPASARDESGRTVRLAFDHEKILGLCVQRLRGKLDYAPIGFELLPDRFTLRSLQEVHETILGKAVNKDSFRRRMLASGSLRPTGEVEQDVTHRPAELYSYRPEPAR